MVVDLDLRKYAHRRLFDRKRGRFLTLAEIADLMEAGASMTAKGFDGRDISAEVLAQIVVRNEARSKRSPLTTAAMRDIIRLTQSDLKLLLPLPLDHLAAMLEMLPPATDTEPFDIKTRNGSGTSLEEDIETQVEHSYAKRLVGDIS